jgi:hypothetical protein
MRIPATTGERLRRRLPTPVAPKGGTSVKGPTRLHAVRLASVLLLSAPPLVSAQTPDTLVYADFETVQDNRPVSSRGGFIQLVSYQENDLQKSTYKGIEGMSPGAPEWVRIKKDDPNHAIKFDFALKAPNQYAGVGVEIHGQPDKDGKTVADDVTGYKQLSLQVYATGATRLRVETMSRGQGVDLQAGYPQKEFKVQPGLNTYKVPLKTLQQPSWVEIRLDPKEILKRLTAVGITVLCEACTPTEGMVIVDNVAFEK